MGIGRRNEISKLVLIIEKYSRPPFSKFAASINPLKAGKNAAAGVVAGGGSTADAAEVRWREGKKIKFVTSMASGSDKICNTNIVNRDRS